MLSTARSPVFGRSGALAHARTHKMLVSHDCMRVKKTKTKNTVSRAKKRREHTQALAAKQRRGSMVHRPMHHTPAQRTSKSCQHGARYKSGIPSQHKLCSSASLTCGASHSSAKRSNLLTPRSLGKAMDDGSGGPASASTSESDESARLSRMDRTVDPTRLNSRVIMAAMEGEGRQLK